MKTNKAITLLFKGPLLDTIQMSRLYPDSKTFVDKKLKHPVGKIIRNFESLVKEQLDKNGELLTVEQIKQVRRKWNINPKNLSFSPLFENPNKYWHGMRGENVCLPDSQEKSDGGWVQLRTNKRTLLFKMLLIFHIVHVATSMALSNVHNMHLPYFPIHLLFGHPIGCQKRYPFNTLNTHCTFLNTFLFQLFSPPSPYIEFLSAQ